MKQDIEVEISSFCNLNCRNCNVYKRLHIPKEEKQIDEGLVCKIIKYVPMNSRLIFIGLGEPLMYFSQKKILEILNTRKDLTGFVQTNGTFKLSKELISLIKEKRLEIGLSYDEQHFENKVSIKVQPELVSAISIAVEDVEGALNFDFDNLQNLFPNLDRILVEPLIDRENSKPLVCAKEIKKVLGFFAKNLKKIKIYTEMYSHFVKMQGFRKYYFEMLEGLNQLSDNWFYSKECFYVYKGDVTKNHARILGNGKVIEDLSKIHLSWEELKKENLLDLKYFFLN